VMNNFKKHSKLRLIELDSENVIRFQSRTLFVQELNKLETLRKKFLGVFYFILSNIFFKNKLGLMIKSTKCEYITLRILKPLPFSSVIFLINFGTG